MKKLLLISSISLVVFLTACGTDSKTESSVEGRFNDSIVKTEESVESVETPLAEATTSQTEITTTQGTTTKVTTTPENVTTSKATTQKPVVTTKKPVVTTKPVTTTTKPTYSSDSEYISEVIRLVNVERAKYGLSAVTTTSQLANAAKIRAQETITSFSHTRPNGTSCFTVLTETNISYRTCGENIAAGQRTPQEVVQGWMNSEGHRANILNGSFTKLGVGFVKADTGYKYYWTQLFIG